MIIIAHRGNLDGPNPDKENHPDYIATALDAGFNVEIDLWIVNNKCLLGHDSPQYEVDFEFISNPKFWIHCKNITALHQLNESSHCYDYYDYFYHNIDDVVLTSRCWLWTFPGKEITSMSIAVMPERVRDWDISEAAGICTDFPRKYK